MIPRTDTQSRFVFQQNCARHPSRLETRALTLSFSFSVVLVVIRESRSILQYSLRQFAVHFRRALHSLARLFSFTPAFRICSFIFAPDRVRSDASRIQIERWWNASHGRMQSLERNGKRRTEFGKRETLRLSRRLRLKTRL